MQQQQLQQQDECNQLQNTKNSVTPYYLDGKAFFIER